MTGQRKTQMELKLGPIGPNNCVKCFPFRRRLIGRRGGRRFVRFLHLQTFFFIGKQEKNKVLIFWGGEKHNRKENKDIEPRR